VAAASEMVTIVPATVIVPLRKEVDEFAAT
jgi:hypothetical protein